MSLTKCHYPSTILSSGYICQYLDLYMSSCHLRSHVTNQVSLSLHYPELRLHLLILRPIHELMSLTKCHYLSTILSSGYICQYLDLYMSSCHLRSHVTNQVSLSLQEPILSSGYICQYLDLYMSSCHLRSHVTNQVSLSLHYPELRLHLSILRPIHELMSPKITCH